MRGPRTQAERDAQTVEIGFALLSGAVLAGLALLAFMGLAALVGEGLGLFSPSDGNTLLSVAGGTCVTVFVGRVVYVLRRAPAGQQGADLEDEELAGDARHLATDHMGTAGPQPSQPGRTSPDS